MSEICFVSLQLQQKHSRTMLISGSFVTGTGTVVNKPGIKQYQQATRDRSKSKTEGGKIIRVEAHPIPEHPRPRRVKGRVALVGDAAGYVTKCSGEGIYFAAKSGRMCAEAIVEKSAQGLSLSLTAPQPQFQSCFQLLLFPGLWSRLLRSLGSIDTPHSES